MHLARVCVCVDVTICARTRIVCAKLVVCVFTTVVSFPSAIAVHTMYTQNCLSRTDGARLLPRGMCTREERCVVKICDGV